MNIPLILRWLHYSSDFSICKVFFHHFFTFNILYIFFTILTLSVIQFLYILHLERNLLMNTSSKKHFSRGILFTLAGGTFWGICGSFGQFLFEYKEVTSNWLVPFRLTISGFLLLLIFYFRKKEEIFEVWKTPKFVFQISLYGLLGMMLCQYTYFRTIEYSNAGIATVLQYLSPTFVLIFVSIQKRALPRIREGLALILATGGTFLIATHGNLNSFVVSKETLIWGLLAALTCTFYTLSSSSLLKHFDAGIIVGWGMLIGGCFLSLVLKPWQYSIILDFETILVFSMIVIFGTILAFTLYLTGIKYIGPALASMIASIEPFTATLLSIFWFKVSFTFVDFIGMACILSTVFLLSTTPQKKKSPKA